MKRTKGNQTSAKSIALTISPHYRGIEKYQRLELSVMTYVVYCVEDEEIARELFI